MSKALEAGDLVVLKSGGPTMVVTATRIGDGSGAPLSEEGDHELADAFDEWVGCSWFDDQAQFHSAAFPRVGLATQATMFDSTAD